MIISIIQWTSPIFPRRIPELLNEVHGLIENKKITFLLTGSSARKLRKGKANLLAGRVWKSSMFPLTRKEIIDFDLDRFLLYGGLPAVYLSNYPDEELDAYVNTYLKEEIMAEGLIQKIAAVFTISALHCPGKWRNDQFH